mgnify:CR=1 FL=1
MCRPAAAKMIVTLADGSEVADEKTHANAIPAATAPSSVRVTKPSWRITPPVWLATPNAPGH